MPCKMRFLENLKHVDKNVMSSTKVLSLKHHKYLEKVGSYKIFMAVL